MTIEHKTRAGTRRRQLLASALLLTVLSATAFATGAEAPAERLQERPKPPQAAFDACKSRSEGDACTVEFRDQKVSGTCRKLPDASDLVCFPAGLPPGGGARP